MYGVIVIHIKSLQDSS